MCPVVGVEVEAEVGVGDGVAAEPCTADFFVVVEDAPKLSPGRGRFCVFIFYNGG